MYVDQSDGRQFESDLDFTVKNKKPVPAAFPVSESSG